MIDKAFSDRVSVGLLLLRFAAAFASGFLLGRTRDIGFTCRTFLATARRAAPRLEGEIFGEADREARYGRLAVIFARGNRSESLQHYSQSAICVICRFPAEARPTVEPKNWPLLAASTSFQGARAYYML